VQSFVVDKVASYLSSELNTKVTVQRVRFELIKNFILDGVYVEDLDHDTLLYANTISASVAFQSLLTQNKKLILDRVNLSDARIGLKKYKESRDMNFQFIIDYFKSPKADTTSAPFSFSINKINIQNLHFTYRDYKWNDTTSCIDFDDIDVNKFNAEIFNFQPLDSVIKFYGTNISFQEKSGFKVNHFSANTAITKDSMSFSKIIIHTPYSDIDAPHYSMSYKSMEDFEDFIDKVYMKGEFTKSSISSNDLQYFASELRGLNKAITFQGAAHGTVSNLKTKQLVINYGVDTHFEGDVSMNGLPDVNTTFLNLNIRSLTTSKSDAETIKLFPFTNNEYIKLPDNLSELGKIKYKGVFTGFYNDFVSYGNISTALGEISTDINLKFNEDMNKSSYSGKLTATDFDIGRFWRLGSQVGTISLNAELTGNGFTSEKVAAKLIGTINQVSLNNYTYRNIVLDANVARKLFNGTLDMHDENAMLNFKGSIDFREKLPYFDFTASVKNAALSKLNLLNRDTSALFSAVADLKMHGFSFDNFDGVLQFKNINYSEENKSASINNLKIESIKEDGEKSIQLNSDVVDFSLSGNYTLTKIINSVGGLLNIYLPPFLVNITPSEKTLSDNFRFDGKIKNINPILNIFTPGLTISDETTFNGKVNRNANYISLQLQSPWTNYNNLENKNLNINIFTFDNRLNAEINSARLKMNDSLLLKNIKIGSDFRKNRSTIVLNIENDSTSKSKLKLSTEQLFENGRTIFHFLPSTLLIEGDNWNINPANEIVFDSTQISFQNFVLSNQNQSVQLSGNISKQTSDKLRLGLFQFNTVALNQLLALYDIKIAGIASGELFFSSLYTKPVITGNLKVSDFEFNDDKLGDAIANIDWITEKKTMHIEGAIEQNGRNSAVITGNYIFKPKHDEIDFNIKADKLSIAPLEHYFKGFASKLKGLTTAELHLYGTANAPLLTGKAKLQRASLVIDYLNTRYSIMPEQEIVFGEKYFEFNDVQISDDFNNKGTVSGKIFHKNLNDFIFNLRIDARKLQCLNTNASQNELFYGKAFATGYAKLMGTPNLMKMEIVVKSEDGTQIFIPLSNPDEITQSNYITFINVADTTKLNTGIKKTEISGIDMDLQVEATPEAEIQLIFDSKIGDVMKGNGNGIIRMLLNPAGEFKMYGDYHIQAGDYLFTLQNIVNKRFKVKTGEIHWAGSPYDANIDITAKYNLRASTFELIPDSSNRSRVPVEVVLQLKNNLMSPDVLFDINVPNATPAIQTSLRSVLGNEREMNRQVFSLLVLNRFSVPEGKTGTEETSSGNAVGQNLSEFVSQQISNWASQLSDKFNIGVNYRPGDALNKDEFDVSVATELFKNRVAVESNVGVANNSNQTSNIIGDFTVEFKISKDGNLRAKAFNKTNTNNLINNLNSQYTQGIGVFYRKEFNTVSDLVESFRRKRKDKTTN
jgi:hypothetical protein